MNYSRTIWVAAAASLAMLWAVACGGGGEEAVAVQDGGLRSIAGEIRSHATAMREHGERLVAIGQAEASSTWLAHGRHLQDDARSMEMLADQVERTAASLTLMRPSVQLIRLASDARALIAAGRLLAEHSRAMEELAASMRADARGRPALLEGLDLWERDVRLMAGDGARVEQAGQALLAEAQRLARSLGRELP